MLDLWLCCMSCSWFLRPCQLCNEFGLKTLSIFMVSSNHLDRAPHDWSRMCWMTFLLRSLLVRIWAHISKADVCGFNLFQVHVKRNVRTHYLLLLHLLLGFVSHYCCSFGSSANNIVIVLKLLYIPGKPSAHCFGHFPKCPKFWSLESVPF